MEALAQLERNYKKAQERGARPELLKRLREQIGRQRHEKVSYGNEFCPEDEDPFEALFKKAVTEINRRYVEEAIDDCTCDEHRELYEKTNGAEDRLNEVWKAGLEGKATLQEFREALKEWYQLNVKGIEIYEREVSG